MAKSEVQNPYRKAYPLNEVGRVYTQASTAAVLDALKLVRRGWVYDLGIERYRGMPVHPIHPPFEVIGYRTPTGLMNERDQAWMETGNDANMRVLSEVIFGTMHTGTHIDALAHISCGADNHWFGGHTAEKHLGDRGPLKADGSKLVPIVTRGVLLDIPRLLGVDVLPGHFAVDAGVLARAAEAQGLEVQAGDTVLVRTGYLQKWPGDEARSYFGSGLTLDGARWLAERGVVNVGGDNESLEQIPAVDPHNPHPVHTYFLIEEGIHIMEFVNVEELARDQVYEFLFIAAPLTVRNTTGSMINPIALV